MHFKDLSNAIRIPRMGVTGSLVAVCLVIGLVPLGLAGYYGIFKMTSLLRANMSETLISRTEWQVNRINDNLKLVSQDLSNLAELPSLKKYLEGTTSMKADLESDFLEFNKANSQYCFTRLVDMSGQEIVRANNKNEKFFLTSSKELHFLGNDLYFQKGAALTKGDIYIPPISIGAEKDTLQQVAIKMLTPVYLNDTKRGMLVVDLFASRFFEWLQLPKTPFTSMLLNSDGKILYVQNNDYTIPSEKTIEEGHAISEFFTDLDKEKIIAMGEDLVSAKWGMMITRPIQMGDLSAPHWFISTFLPTSYFSSYSVKLTVYLLASLVIVGFLAVASAMFIAKKFTRSIRDLYTGADLIASGNYDNEIRLETGDEFEDLAGKLNRVRQQVRDRQSNLMETNSDLKHQLDLHRVEVRSLERQVFRADKLASVGELSMKLAHEIGNPLASLKTVTQMLAERALEGPNQEHHFNKIVSEVDRLNLFLKKFNNFAVMKEIEPVSCDLKQLVRDVNYFMKAQAGENNISLEEVFEPGEVKIFGDLQQIKQIMVNLILNALQATPDSGKIKISLRNGGGQECICEIRDNCFCEKKGLDVTGNGMVELSVCDNGSGIPENDLNKVFDPFYSTKLDGTGLGLSIVHKIVEKHKGMIRVFSKQGEGTTFRVYLPKFTEGSVA